MRSEPVPSEVNSEVVGGFLDFNIMFLEKITRNGHLLISASTLPIMLSALILLMLQCLMAA